jgi:hypothetical protein
MLHGGGEAAGSLLFVRDLIFTFFFFFFFFINRGLKFGDGDLLIQLWLWHSVNSNPTWTIGRHREALCELGINVSEDFIGRVFRSWGWTWRKPAHLQVRKFTEENIARYATWVERVIGWFNLFDFCISFFFFFSKTKRYTVATSKVC